MKSKNVKLGMRVKYKRSDGKWAEAKVATLPMHNGFYKDCMLKTIPEGFPFPLAVKKFKFVSRK